MQRRWGGQFDESCESEVILDFCFQNVVRVWGAKLEFIDMEVVFRINLFRAGGERIFDELRQNPHLSQR